MQPFTSLLSKDAWIAGKIIIKIYVAIIWELKFCKSVSLRFSNNVVLVLASHKEQSFVTGDGGTELWLEPPLPPTGPLRGVLILTTVMKYMYIMSDGIKNLNVVFSLV
jgi:hypothetical protein